MNPARKNLNPARFATSAKRNASTTIAKALSVLPVIDNRGSQTFRRLFEVHFGKSVSFKPNTITGGSMGRVRLNLESTLSTHRFLHERADLCLFGSSQLVQRESDWPHSTVVEVRSVAEAERRISRFELLRALEEADDLAVCGIRGHP